LFLLKQNPKKCVLDIESASNKVFLLTEKKKNNEEIICNFGDYGLGNAYDGAEPTEIHRQIQCHIWSGISEFRTGNA